MQLLWRKKNIVRKVSDHIVYVTAHYEKKQTWKRDFV